MGIAECIYSGWSNRRLLPEDVVAKFPETRVSLILRLSEPADVLAWQEFAEIYTPALLATARRRGLQAADAEDLTQEVLFAVARSAPDKFALAESQLRIVLDREYESQLMRQEIELRLIEAKIAQLKKNIARHRQAKARIVAVQLGRIVLDSQGLLDQ